MEKSSSSRSRSRSAEKNQASSYSNGGLSPCNTKSDPLSAYRQRLSSNERDPLLCQGKESSRRYAAFLKQDGLLPLDNNLNNDERNGYSLERDNIQISTLESPVDLIAPERLTPAKERRPASTPAAAFHLPSSRSHPGPRHSNACNFNIDFGNFAAGRKPSTTSIEDEAEADEFQNDLTDVTQQLELIQETQGNILTELSNDILALQIENASLKESKDRLQSTNDNLVKVVHDLTKECTRLKMQHSSTASVSKVTRLHKPPEEMHGAGATLSTSRSNQQILKTQIPNGNKSGRKDIKPKVKEENQNQVRRSQSGGRHILPSSSRTSCSRDDLQNTKPSCSRDDLRNTKLSYSRDDIKPPPHHHLKSIHSRENYLRHKSKSHNLPSCEKHREKAHSHRSEPPPREENRPSSKSKHRKSSSNYAGHEKERSDRQNKHYESTVENEDSDSDDGRPIDRGDKRKKKKSGCFSFMRRRSYNEDHRRERD